MLHEVYNSVDRISDEVFVAVVGSMVEYLPENMDTPRIWASKRSIPASVDCFGSHTYGFNEINKLIKPNDCLRTYPTSPLIVRFWFLLLVELSLTTLILILLPWFLNCLSTSLRNARSSAGSSLNCSNMDLGVLVGFRYVAFFCGDFLSDSFEASLDTTRHTYIENRNGFEL